MQSYLDLLEKVLTEGSQKSDRTGTGTLSLFGEHLRINLQDGFPLLTTKRVFFKGVAAELLWILSGSTNANDLPEYVRQWWTPWAAPDGSLGPVYGEQMRASRTLTNYGGCVVVDQLANALASLKTDEDSRRHVINLWHTPAMKEARLPCCHGSIIQFYVGGGHLSCHMYQRSADIILGVPVNIACYALLTSLLAIELNLQVGELVVSYGDLHLYSNHIEQAKLQLTRKPTQLPSLGVHHKPGALLWRVGDSLEAPRYLPEDFFLVGYNPAPAIKAPVAV